MKRYISPLIKGLISLFLLTYLLTRIDLKKMEELFSHTKLYPVLVALIIYIAGQILCAYRWKLLAEVMDFHNSFKEFISYYFAGMFMNLFLPTSIGGDVGKCYLLSKKEKRIKEAIITILADRGSGLAVLIFMAGASIYMLHQPLSPSIKWAILTGNVAVITGLIFPFLVKDYFSTYPLIQSLLSYWKRTRPLLTALSLSLLFQLMVVVIHILLASSMGIIIPWQYFFLLVPVTALSSMLPVSLSGLGVREWTYVYFLSFINIPPTEGFSLGILWFFLVFLAGLMGGIVFFAGNISKEILNR